MKKLLKIYITLALLCCCGFMVMGTIAYLQKGSSLENTFVKGSTDIEIEETFNAEKTMKSDIYFSNKGNTEVYIRAKVLIYYKDSSGNILGDVPVEEVDYLQTPGSDTAWIYKDGVYYHKTPVAPLSKDGKTEVLISSIKDLLPNDDRYLVVDILAQSIQALPTSVVVEVWNAEIDSNHHIIQIQ